ncbi:MAG TPA: hypothetical protein VMR06_05150 [Dokdonella sp.]|uniref:hypothetical protein n=1 Tax=Dokdonella sp. TaxID=2291710 RepID=UPI002C1798D9|nr:hypothetical protein [Dokdonella sp.]HUD41368.1 hypothetical protein [Dokdonella sp.]
MKCKSTFRPIRPLLTRIEEAAYGVMAQIEYADNVRVLAVGPSDEWVQVEYDWHSDTTHYDATDALAKFGLEKSDRPPEQHHDPLA